jgi:hypothetical protein
MARLINQSEFTQAADAGGADCCGGMDVKEAVIGTWVTVPLVRPSSCWDISERRTTAFLADSGDKDL